MTSKTTIRSTSSPPHKIVPGEYISIDEDDGERHTFKIVSVDPV
ncbi:MAG: hypothetical protein U1E87_07075 [Alphaproteobacteria bacterium]